MVLRKSFYIRWSAGRSPWVHEVNPGRDPSDFMSRHFSRAARNDKLVATKFLCHDTRNLCLNNY